MNSIEYLGGGDELRVANIYIYTHYSLYIRYTVVILLQLLDHVDDVDVR